MYILQIFSLVCGLPFHFLNSIFGRAEAFILMKSDLLIFFFLYSLNFLYPMSKSFLTQVRFSLKFSYKSSIVLVLNI